MLHPRRFHQHEDDIFVYLKYEIKSDKLPHKSDDIRVCAVIVAYHPYIEELETLITYSRSQVSELLVIDNGFGETPGLGEYLTDPSIPYIGLPENIGLAAAQNIGIAWAKERGFSHILFLDQDSIPQRNMVKRLIEALIDLEDSGTKVAAVGPLAVDSRTQRMLPFINFRKFYVKKIYCLRERVWQYARADFLISSGMLVPLRIFDQVGMMDDRLFIDSVDMEWCFRIQHQGFSLYGICDARLLHRLGDRVITIGERKPFNIYQHSPLRQYYMMRNRILLYRRYYVPMSWRIQDFFRMIIKICFLTCLTSDRTNHLRMITKGLWDGVWMKTGKYRGGVRF